MRNLLFLMLVLIFTSCKTKKQTIWSAEQEAREQTTENVVVVNDIKSGNDLTTHLRGISGLRVQGSGSNAKITIRGANSFALTTEPLFVVDGQRYTGTYNALYNDISVNNIKSINVLKDPASLGVYGSSGSNGVIEIKTKK
ncbi:TonB-dependent outer membrane receptor, SusC/RagA subfamily, signature region [Flaviramulus basaltis]|uniref:TonB-dependent outer membrane receptor, SusC/RagA subfamily, signature region n=1 Tax=Flaviramulus basaltis TaxID=369401 RepID=A0A1K2INC4_9FLAO|nr:TonB-dependent receptor plug domain-containing protein [Flaviramulus basaltis]SFZ93945.1 TonB-dependent outer membrane receptor, SusC/RagA subfamily, signature region [Flaviramulus basaltis]